MARVPALELKELLAMDRRRSAQTYNVKFYGNTQALRSRDVGSARVDAFCDIRSGHSIQIISWEICIAQNQVVVIDTAIKWRAIETIWSTGRCWRWICSPSFRC
jgi:hypothetical protein